MYRATVDNEDTYLLVMRNMFSHRLTVHRKYDLKVDQFHSLIIVYYLMILLLSHNGEELICYEFSMLFKTISAKFKKKGKITIKIVFHSTCIFKAIY